MILFTLKPSIGEMNPPRRIFANNMYYNILSHMPHISSLQEDIYMYGCSFMDEKPSFIWKFTSTQCEVAYFNGIILTIYMYKTVEIV